MLEKDLIKRHLAPLAQQFPPSLALGDDAAIISLPADYELVITKDAISEGIHYLGNENPALIARKLLRVNLSDLAAMGALPYCYFLAIALPSPFSEQYIADFSAGLKADQEEFSIHLAGGDTIATTAAATFSITALGLLPSGTALRRNSAMPGEAIYVSGTLGDAALGLQIIKNNGNNGKLSENSLINRYLLPQPRISLGKELRDKATSCTDISDGLLADLENICTSSSVGAEINLESLPLSQAAQEFLADNPQLLPLIYSGGDDYELLFTMPANATPLPNTTLIGKITAEKTIKLLKNGKEIEVKQKGYSH